MSNDWHSPPTSGTFSINVTDSCGGHARHIEVGTVLYCMYCMQYMEIPRYCVWERFYMPGLEQMLAIGMKQIIHSKHAYYD